MAQNGGIPPQEMQQSQHANLPLHLIAHVFSFCDCRTVSSFLSAAVASDHYRSKTALMVATILQERLMAFVAFLSRTPSCMPRLMSSFVTQYASTIREECPTHSWIEAVRYLSIRLAVLDYFEEALTCRDERGGAEWLVWCGNIRLVYPATEVRSMAHFSRADLCECNVKVEITSPCWYPNLAHKWERAMSQCSDFGSDVSRRRNRGRQLGRQRGRHIPTHMARVAPIGQASAESVIHFNKGKRSGDFIYPMDLDVPAELVLDRLCLASPKGAYTLASSIPWIVGNMKICAESARTSGDDRIFAFWTDMCPTDRMRSYNNFTADIFKMQKKRDQLSRCYP